MIARRPGPVGTLVAWLPFALLLAAAACDRMPLTAPTKSVITLFATATSVPATGSTDIIATVMEESGTPVQNGTVVSFTTTLGRIEPAEARTQNGKVTVKLTGDGRSGRATITAFSGAAKNGTLELPIGTAAAGAVIVRAEPPLLPPGGGTTQIVALIQDEGGNPLSGASVSFSTTAGTLSSSLVTTDANGEARTTLTTARQTTVTARVGALTGTVIVKVNEAPSATITADPLLPREDQPVVFTITVTPGGLPITQARIDFGDGSSQQLGALSGSTTVAHVYGSDDGPYVVTLTLTDAGGNVSTHSIIIVVQPPESADDPPPGPAGGGEE